jgi:uncharacterized membrane protein
MTKGRLEAFSDGVLAIIITIMVLELKVPHEPSFEALGPLWPVMTSYLLSFVLLAIYWNNHHHLLHASQHVDGRVLWANMHLLFWLSLTPFVTAWMGETHFGAVPVFFYGVVQLLAAVAYFVLARALVARHGRDSTLARALGADRKGMASLALYALGIVASLFDARVALALYVAVAVIWLVPDRRIERALGR